jgi:hypothetical protein
LVTYTLQVRQVPNWLRAPTGHHAQQWSALVEAGTPGSIPGPATRGWAQAQPGRAPTEGWSAWMTTASRRCPVQRA